MGYKLTKFAKVVDTLEPGEQFVAGAYALAPGGVKRQALAAGAFGAIGAVVSARRTTTSGSFELPTTFVVGLTDRRLMFFKTGALGNAPKSVIGAMPRADVVGAGFVDSGMMSRSVRVDLRNGQRVEMEVQKGLARKWMDELLAQLGAPAPLPSPAG